MLCAGGAAEGITDEEIARRAQVVMSVVGDEPNCEGSLNMVRPFEPVIMTPATLMEQEAAFFLEMGIEEDRLAEAGRIGGDEVIFYDSDGRRITILFSGYEYDHAFVFEKSTDGTERLIDIVYSGYGNGPAADYVELSGGRYLLLNVYAHGSGTMRNWTAWYNLDARKVELYTVREGHESDYPVVAKLVTHTNVDHALNLTDPYSRPEELITYSYMTVYTSLNENRSEVETVIDDQCTVRVYSSYEGGLRLEGERVFDSYTPAVLEQMSGKEILDTGWRLAWQNEKADGVPAGAAQDNSAQIAVLASALPKAKVVNADWVNIRREGTKESPAIAEAKAGELVYVISENNGFENGWSHVLRICEDEPPVVGYIWWSFLAPVE
ncbi:MAG: hypothetical protein J6K32_10060 [Clostridia bacterium]|nr:hypothetical protein [Clostridia bacterium]